jgi:hypothetical protein
MFRSPNTIEEQVATVPSKPHARDCGELTHLPCSPRNRWWISVIAAGMPSSEAGGMDKTASRPAGERTDHERTSHEAASDTEPDRPESATAESVPDPFDTDGAGWVPA